MHKNSDRNLNIKAIARFWMAEEDVRYGITVIRK